MHELGIATNYLEQIQSGQKTVECRLGKPQYLKIRPGDEIAIHEEVWRDGTIISSKPSGITLDVTQILYFESFEDAFGAMSYKDAIPSATSKAEAIAAYRLFYTSEDEQEYGVMAIFFELVS